MKINRQKYIKIRKSNKEKLVFNNSQKWINQTKLKINYNNNNKKLR